MRNANQVFAFVLLLLASSLGAQQVNLTWDPSPSTCSGLGYNVYRSMTAGTYAGPPVNTKLIIAAPTAAAPFVDSTVQQGLTYFYIVKTSCSGLESAPSNEVTAKVADARILPPPAGLTSTCTPDGKTVTVSWKPVAGATSYYLRFSDANDRYTAYDQYVPTSKMETITPGLDYSWWVHSYSPTAGAYNPDWVPGIGPEASARFKCDPLATQPAANLEIVFVSPTATVVPVRQTTPVTVQVSGPVSGIWFYINDTLKDSKTGSTLRYNWRPKQRGSYTLKAVVLDRLGKPAPPVLKTVTVQ